MERVNDMNLKQLEAFVKVAETKSFSSAAKLLYLTQPTVSAHIASLEKELNACLLVRSTKGVALSEAGKELYAYAEQMLELEQKIRVRFGLGAGGRGSVLRIAASTVPSQYLLPDILSSFREEYPGEQLKVFETDSAGVVDMILTHKADVGFTGTVLEKGGCTYLPFYQDELVIITPATERFLSRQGADVAAWIREEPLILRGRRIRHEKGDCKAPFPDGDRYGRVLYCGCHGKSGDDQTFCQERDGDLYPVRARG